MIKINDQKSRLHLVACNRNQRSALHALHASHVISCCISCHFMLHFTHFIVRITCIARMSRMSRISHFMNSTHFMHCTIHHVILCIISCHFAMKIHSILIHGIPNWRERKKGQNGTLFNWAPAKWGVLIRRIKMPPEWGIFSNDKGAASSRRFIS